MNYHLCLTSALTTHSEIYPRVEEIKRNHLIRQELWTLQLNVTASYKDNFIAKTNIQNIGYPQSNFSVHPKPTCLYRLQEQKDVHLNRGLSELLPQFPRHTKT